MLRDPRGVHEYRGLKQTKAASSPALIPINTHDIWSLDMYIQDITVLVTGANRGIGRALAEALIQQDAAHVYAAARRPETLDALVAQAPERITPVQLDVNRLDDIAALLEQVSTLDLLINNAGVLASGSLLEANRADIEQDMRTNFFGPLAVTRALLPVLKDGGGAVVNMLTLAALGSMPVIGGYSASKAAAFSMTQALRAKLAPLGIRVHGVFPGPVDTDMIRSFEMPKATPESVARAVLAAVEAGEEEIFPDAMAREIGAAWLQDPKAVERSFASL